MPSCQAGAVLPEVPPWPRRLTARDRRLSGLRTGRRSRAVDPLVTPGILRTTNGPSQIPSIGYQVYRQIEPHSGPPWGSKHVQGVRLTGIYSGVVAFSDDCLPVLSGAYRSTVTFKTLCPSTGEEITITRPGDRLDPTFECPSCGDLHQIETRGSPSEGPRTVREQPILVGRVKFFGTTKGWGAIISPDLPHDIWVHFSVIEGEGYRALAEGDEVEFTYEDCWGHQDSWHYRATWARLLPAP